MIGPVRHDDTAVPCDCACNVIGQRVGLCPAADENAGVDLIRQGGDDAFGIGDDVVVQIAAVGIDLRCLMGERAHDMRMAMPDRGHVVVAIQICLSFVVPDCDAFCAHRGQRVIVVVIVARAEHIEAALKEGVRRFWLIHWHSLLSDRIVARAGATPE